MVQIPDNLLRDALALPEHERVDLAARLLESLDGPPQPDYEASWSREIRRRLDDLEAGSVEPVPWNEARRQIFGPDDPEAR